jgi:hypothetical protein
VEFTRLLITMRASVIMMIFGLLVGCTSSGRWNPSSATAEAERDIASSHLRFAYVGGYAPHTPGLPLTESTHEVLGKYGRRAVGPQGCVQDKQFEQRTEYARRYNLRMWSYVSALE